MAQIGKKNLEKGLIDRVQHRRLVGTTKLFAKRCLEVESGFVCLDYFSRRGRKRAEKLLPNLLVDIKAIVDSQSQVDPKFWRQRLYTRLDTKEVCEQLILPKGYIDAETPTIVTIITKLNGLGYYPQKIAKSESKKSGAVPKGHIFLLGQPKVGLKSRFLYGFTSKTSKYPQKMALSGK